jgi:outer membrane receptor protein involved in Fe transport
VNRAILVAVLACVARASADEPPARLRGEVIERGTRDRLTAFVTCADAAGAPLASVDTDEQGRFEVRLPAALAGRIAVVVTSPGHKPLRVAEQLVAKVALTVNYALERSTYARYEATVRGTPAREEVARTSLDADEIHHIPGTRGDALQAVLNLPSVARAPFDLGLLVIRGSQPGESGAFLSGMQIPEAFHFGGLTSTFNSYLLERFDLIPSNFSPRYGRLVGGVVDIVPREGKRDRIHGDLKIDLYDAHAILEGPLKKGWFALSFRRSYIDAVIGYFLPVDSLTVAPRYYDYSAMFGYPIGPGKLQLTVFGSDDQFEFVQATPPSSDPSLSGQFGTRQWFHSLITSYTAKAYGVEHEYKLQVSPQHYDGQLGGAAQFHLDLVEIDARAEWRWRASPGVRWIGGVDFQSNYSWVFVDAPRIVTEEKVQGPLATQDKVRLSSQGYDVYPAVYGQVEWSPVDALRISPGVRVDWFARHNGTYVQPRVSARLRVARDVFVKAAAGLYCQPPQPPYDDPVLGNPRIHPEQAWHITVGVEGRPLPRWKALFVDFNVFYKDLRNLAVGSDQLTMRGGHIQPEVYSDEGIGRVYGADLLIKHDHPKSVFGWVSYTLLKSERQDHPGLPWRPFQFDQTHILILVAGYHAPLDFDFGVRFRYVTGNPDTPILGGVYDADRNAWIPLPGAPYSTRLPDFVQLDVRIDKRFIFKKWIFAAYVDISNVTNRGNIETYSYSYDFQRPAGVHGLPIIPSLGLRASF